MQREITRHSQRKHILFAEALNGYSSLSGKYDNVHKQDIIGAFANINRVVRVGSQTHIKLVEAFSGGISNSSTPCSRQRKYIYNDMCQGYSIWQ